jgi:hypothetical protein
MQARERMQGTQAFRAPSQMLLLEPTSPLAPPAALATTAHPTPWRSWAGACWRSLAASPPLAQNGLHRRNILSEPVCNAED